KVIDSRGDVTVRRRNLLVVVLLVSSCSGGGKEQAEEWSNTPSPPRELSEKGKEAAALAKKLFDHFGPDGLDQFTWRSPGDFEPLLKADVLSDTDAEIILRHGFRDFEFRRSAGFSRRYEFSFGTGPDTSFGGELDHKGQPVLVDGETDKSEDLQADVNLMWSIGAGGKSPQVAIHAGSRVFNTVELVGMHRDQIIRLIGDFSRRPGGYYNFPFWPADRGDLVYRFDNGFYGWQFNVKLNRNGVCERV